MSEEHTGSPKGNIRLHPGYRNDDDQRETTRVAYYVARTPERFIDSSRPEKEQEWAVLPDLPATHVDFEPKSVHSTKQEAIAQSRKLDKKQGTYNKRRASNDWLRPEQAAARAWSQRQVNSQRTRFRSTPCASSFLPERRSFFLRPPLPSSGDAR